LLFVSRLCRFQTQNRRQTLKKIIKVFLQGGLLCWKNQVWTDLKAKVRRVDGPFSPKMFDGDYLLTEKKWIEDKLQNNGFGSADRWQKNVQKCSRHVALAENEHCIPSKIERRWNYCQRVV
jgi:hypothetical protein